MINDFPKLHSPFIRETINDSYVVTPKIDPDYNWVFEDSGVMAVDKIDGTNVSLIIEKGQISRIFNRTNEKFIFSVRKQTAWDGACMEGIAQAIQRGWLKDCEGGQIFGELIGPKFNGNRHKLDYHLFVPFDYLKKHCFWKSWVQNKYPKTFESISEWFKDLPSLFNQRLGLPEIQTEGLVFYHPDGRMCKLRKDMFDWYVGERHND
jgi:hypothetical protein